MYSRYRKFQLVGSVYPPEDPNVVWYDERARLLKLYREGNWETIVVDSASLAIIEDLKVLIDESRTLSNTLTSTSIKVENIEKSVIKYAEYSDNSAQSALKSAEKAQEFSESSAGILNSVNSIKGDFDRQITEIDISTIARKNEVTSEINSSVDVINQSISKEKEKLEALIGADQNKTIRKIANEELVNNLIPETAKESLDTLLEIAEWIQNHPDEAAALNSQIEELKTSLADTTATAKAAATKQEVKKAIGDIDDGKSVAEVIQDAQTNTSKVYATKQGLVDAINQAAYLKDSSYALLTEAEYDALVEAETVDNDTVYLIVEE